MRREVVEAAYDYRYLLDKGYPHKLSLDIICNRYILTKKERLLLYRCVHPSSYVRSTLLKKGIPPRGSQVIIDGYNLFSTIYAILQGDNVYLCDDNIVRDLSGLRRKVSATINLNTINDILDVVEKYVEGYIVEIVFDASVSHSGELARYVRKKLPYISVSTEKKADKYIIKRASVRDRWVTTSDAVIIERVFKIYDLGGIIAREYAPNNIIVMPLPRVLW